MTPEEVPDYSSADITGTLPTANLYDYANFVVKPELARAFRALDSSKSSQATRAG